MQKRILFVSHFKKQCGVHDFGSNVANVLQNSRVYKFIYVECNSLKEFEDALRIHTPDAILYNYHPSTMPWIRKKIVHKFYLSLNGDLPIPQAGIMHEVTQEKADKSDNLLFDYHIAPDPTLLLKNPIVYKTGRLLTAFHNPYPVPELTTIGSFGFATPNKGFEEVVSAVQDEYDQAIIRFNIPSADFGDEKGEAARILADRCRNMITKKGISLEITHDFLNNTQLLDFLARNTANIFLYQDKTGRGLSSTVDYALAVDRPLVVSDSIMFRHLHEIRPSIVYGTNTIRQIINNGTAPLNPIRNYWNAENLLWEYERIFNSVFTHEKISPVFRSRKKKRFKSFLNKAMGKSERHFSWLTNTKSATEDDLSLGSQLSYHPVELPEGTGLNRILDNSARKLYTNTTEVLKKLVPHTISKKIPEANVQQAFVFDTVWRMTPQYTNPRTLCVGSYEDTACMSLRKLGFVIDEIDPVLNYYLQEYITKPGVLENSYDIIFSTSVIEHDPDDKSFIQCISRLLAPGGTAILTCDYDDNWKPGLPKPDVDVRLYTQKDLRERLVPLMKDCVLIDQPQWDCPAPDFVYLGKYHYTFASMVVRKLT